jgi:hypothetical protein
MAFCAGVASCEGASLKGYASLSWPDSKIAIVRAERESRNRLAANVQEDTQIRMRTFLRTPLTIERIWTVNEESSVVAELINPL